MDLSDLEKKLNQIDDILSEKTSSWGDKVGNELDYWESRADRELRDLKGRLTGAERAAIVTFSYQRDGSEVPEQVKENLSSFLSDFEGDTYCLHSDIQDDLSFDIAEEFDREFFYNPSDRKDRDFEMLMQEVVEENDEIYLGGAYETTVSYVKPELNWREEKTSRDTLLKVVPEMSYDINGAVVADIKTKREIEEEYNRDVLPESFSVEYSD